MSESEQNEPFVLPENIYGDVRDALLMQVRSMEDPWSKLSEDQQSDRIEAVNNAASNAIRRILHAVAAKGFEKLSVVVKDFNVKGGVIKGKFEAIVSEHHVVTLSEHQDSSALILMVDPGAFMNDQNPAQPDPQQPVLPLDEDEDGQDD
jgi:hypothetical protein